MQSIFSESEKILEALDIIKSSDMFLVGIGTELAMGRRDEDELNDFFKDIAKLLKGKNYFLITLNTDGFINDAGLDDDRIVEPCGNVRKLQCPDGCRDAVYPESDFAEGAKVCPECGKILIENTVLAEHYVENGYLDDWKRYTTWVSTTLNRNLCVLELGAKMEFPNIIRWPFEKMVSINNKAKMIRINNALPQLSEETAKKGVGIKGDPAVIVKKLII